MYRRRASELTYPLSTRLSLLSLVSLTQKQQQAAPAGGTQQHLTVMIQGQGQTTGQLQIIPQGVTVIPGPGQQLMQAQLPNGQVQRFLFTPVAPTAAPTVTTGRPTHQNTRVHAQANAA